MIEYKVEKMVYKCGRDIEKFVNETATVLDYGWLPAKDVKAVTKGYKFDEMATNIFKASAPNALNIEKYPLAGVYSRIGTFNTIIVYGFTI